jgi:tetratricopeptide (TPR) repeat protein
MTRGFTIATLAAIGLIAASLASASEYSSLLRSAHYAELERVLNARLSQDPGNVPAIYAKVTLVIATGGDNRVQEAVRLSEKCISAHPNSSQCHEARALALGNMARRLGGMVAIAYAGGIRDELEKAIELDPRNLSARFPLVQFYLEAPGFLGGSGSAAQALATNTGKIDANCAKLLFAYIDIDQKNYAQAEAAALAAESAESAGNDVLTEARHDILVKLAALRLKQKKLSESYRLYSEVRTRFPASDAGLYGVARSLQEQGKHVQAIDLFQRALLVSDRAPTRYRLAVSLQATNDKAQAIDEFKKAREIGIGLPRSMRADIEDRLKTLR